jgi:hypothetical protein
MYLERNGHRIQLMLTRAEALRIMAQFATNLEVNERFGSTTLYSGSMADCTDPKQHYPAVLDVIIDTEE